jgi:hypothetical protein
MDMSKLKNISNHIIEMSKMHAEQQSAPPNITSFHYTKKNEEPVKKE